MLSLQDFDLQMHERGFCHLSGCAPGELEQLLAHLGHVFKITDIKIDERSTAAVNSADAMVLHTDHPRADFLAWYCLRQTDDGGESLLADMDAAFQTLAPRDRDRLYSIRVKVPSPDPQDIASLPMVRERPAGRRRYFYMPWLMVPPEGEAKAALQRLENVLAAGASICLRLQPGDILVLDNSRILHGRNAIRGGRDRHLVRYWIEGNSRPRPGA